MPKRFPMILLITLFGMTACCDPHRDAFIQSQCVEVAAVQEVYDICKKAANEIYDVMNK